MSLFRLALCAAAASLMSVSSVFALALNDDTRASSSLPTRITLCDDATGSGATTEACKRAGYDRLVAAIDTAFAAALAKSPANVRPLFKRDEAWFDEMLLEARDTVDQANEPELRVNMADVLRHRAAELDEIARGFGRGGFSGKWANAFGGINVTAAEAGAYRVDAELNSYYGSDRHWRCRLGATVRPGADGWLAGSVDAPKPAQAADANAAAERKPAEPVAIRLRRQGDTLRLILVAAEQQWFSSEDTDCQHLGQITGSYFASGTTKADDKADTSFTAPTFDCTRPESATDEEICADPDLAANDLRLNRAWKALLPRLDDATRRALNEDQRLWVDSQIQQYPEFLHPAWEKLTSQVHYTVFGRDRVDSLQRERIALLDGFDDKRTGLAGTWLAHDALIQIIVDKDGAVEARGWKWSQGDWKAGCDYEMYGKLVRGTFRSDEQRRNPDTLERDHAMLIVNRLDDVFAKKREGKNDNSDDEPKCKRNTTISSTARLFPAKPSRDIDNPPGEIR
jgi:uncharacterized protein YecT (DUF1311 family)